MWTSHTKRYGLSKLVGYDPSKPTPPTQLQWLPQVNAEMTLSIGFESGDESL